MRVHSIYGHLILIDGPLTSHPATLKKSFEGRELVDPTLANWHHLMDCSPRESGLVSVKSTQLNVAGVLQIRGASRIWLR